MSFRGNTNKFRPRPAKGPIRLQFGLVEQASTKAGEQKVIQAPIVFEKQEIIGTLTLQKNDLTKVKPLPVKYRERILNNLQKIYEEGKYLSTNTVIDAHEQELHISFSFNQYVIDRIKGLDRNERQWDPENKIWKIFIGCFDDAFDILGKGFKITEKAFHLLSEFICSNYYAYIASSKLGKLIIRESWYEELDLSLDSQPFDKVTQGYDINSDKLNKQSENTLSEVEQLIGGFLFKRKPYSHQITGIQFILKNNACALLDEMGCGKSFQIASAMSILLQNKKIDKCLIVAPKSLVKTWEEEIALATDIPFVTVQGSPAQREKLFAKKASIFIIHYEGIRIEQARLTAWLNTGESMLIFDESQRIKNFSAQTTKSAICLRGKAKRCVIATGTPIANRPLDLFSQYYVMDNGFTFGKNFTAFKNTFCYIEILEINQGRKKIKVEKFLGIRNGEELRKRIQSTSLRRLKSEVLDLPPIIYKDYTIELKNEQKSLYAKVRDNIRSEIESISDSAFGAEINQIIVRLLRLSQIASNPRLLHPNYEGPNAKFKELDDLLSDI
ncbi:MAG: DEAD/DEAH box helicase, partial [Silvanigrellaceae bacterium]|nr:DEAD/DEAH box helicase [Silvanigrellaceae bacterium]